MIASLLLSRAKQHIYTVFRELEIHTIPTFYTSTDSIAMPVEGLDVVAERLGDGLGQFKIEARGDYAIFVRAALYICGDKFTALNVSQGDVLAFIKAEGMKDLREFYERLYKGEHFTIPIRGSLHRTV